MVLSKKRRLALTAAAGLASLALTLTSCAQSGGGGGDDAGGDVTLRFAWWGGDARNAATQAAIDIFESENPGITVKGEFSDFNGHFDKLATQVAGGTAPDIIQMDLSYLADYAARGALLDLTDNAEIDTSKLDASAVAGGKVDGKIYGIPNGVSIAVLLANPKLFEQAGVELPDDKTWTWDDYRDLAVKITEGTPDGTYGAESMYTDTDIQIWVQQHGKSVFTSDGKIGFDADDAASFFAEIVKDAEVGATPPAAVTTEQLDVSPEQSGTAAGTIAIGRWASNQLPGLVGALGSDLVILRHPSQTGSAADNGMYFKPGQLWTIASTSKHPAEAAKFVNFLLNSTEAGEKLLLDRGVPINSEVRDAIAPTLPAPDQQVLDFVNEVSSEVTLQPAAPPVGGGDLQSIVKRLTSDVLFGSKTPQEAGKGLVDELQAALDAAS